MESLILYVGESTDLLKSLGGVETIAVSLQRRHFRALLIFRSKKSILSSTLHRKQLLQITLDPVKEFRPS